MIHIEMLIESWIAACALRLAHFGSVRIKKADSNLHHSNAPLLRKQSTEICRG